MEAKALVLIEESLKVRRGMKGRELVEAAYLDSGEGVKEGWHLLREEERGVVAQMVRYAGELGKVGEALRLEPEYIQKMMEVRPWVKRAIDYYMEVGVEALNRAVVQQHVSEGLLDTVPAVLRGKEVAAETKRKTVRDMMEAGGYYPKMGGPMVANQVNVKVEVPDWKK